MKNILYLKISLFCIAPFPVYKVQVPAAHASALQYLITGIINLRVQSFAVMPDSIRHSASLSCWNYSAFRLSPE